MEEQIILNVSVRGATQEEVASVLLHISDLILAGYKKGVGEGEDESKFVFEVKEESF